LSTYRRLSISSMRQLTSSGTVNDRRHLMRHTTPDRTRRAVVVYVIIVLLMVLAAALALWAGWSGVPGW
jgi:hypothetical protein